MTNNPSNRYRITIDRLVVEASSRETVREERFRRQLTDELQRQLRQPAVRERLRSGTHERLVATAGEDSADRPTLAAQVARRVVTSLPSSESR